LALDGGATGKNETVYNPVVGNSGVTPSQKPSRTLTSTVNQWLRAFGIDLPTLYTSLKGLRRFWTGYRHLQTMNSESGSSWRIRPSYPCLTDFYGQSGVARGHYFHQDLYIAQKIFRKMPAKHVDVGSRIDGFVAHIASFRELEVVDYRELAVEIAHIAFRRCDLLRLPLEFHEYCDSLSCLHVLEHIGLGRYGDAIDLNGHAKGLDSLLKMLKPGGTLYLSVPFGAERIEYNAHRVFSLRTIHDLIAPFWDVVEFSMVDDAGNLHLGVDLEVIAGQSKAYHFALAIFELRKRCNSV
jgi:SAM-dependent methyltransferase